MWKALWGYNYNLIHFYSLRHSNMRREGTYMYINYHDITCPGLHKRSMAKEIGGVRAEITCRSGIVG